MRTVYTEVSKKFKKKGSLEEFLERIKSPKPFHTIIENRAFSDPKTTESNRPVELFKRFTTKVLPHMEQAVEIELLRRAYNQLDNDRLRNELLLAYRRRRVNIANIRAPPEPYRDAQDVPPPFFFKSHDIFRDVATLEDDDVGMIGTIPDSEVPKYYKGGFFGTYGEEQYIFSKKLAVQCTEEGFKILNELRKIEQDRLTAKDYEEIFEGCKLPKDFRKAINNEEIFPRIFRDFAVTFVDCLKAYRSDPFMDKIFTNAFFSDAVVNVLVRELCSSPVLRPYLLNQEHRAEIIKQILEHISKDLDRETNSSFLQQTFGYLGEVPIDLSGLAGEKETAKDYTIVFKKYAKRPRYLPTNSQNFGLEGWAGFNSGILLHGRSGTGKSGVLLLATMWAYKRGWVVFSVPDGHKLTQIQPFLERHEASGLYMQLEYAREILDSFREGNRELLAKIPVNAELYGKYNTAGVHQDDPEPVPVTWNAERKVWSNDWEQFLFEDEKKQIREEQRQYEVSITLGLPNPKNLLEIADHGIESRVHPIAAICEIFEQLYNQDEYPFLMAIDGWSWFFRPTNFASFRYANDKTLGSNIPPHHLALVRAFMKFDGHKIKKGMKICASSHKSLQRHTFTPDQINFGKGYDVELSDLPLDHYRIFANNLMQTAVWKRENTNDQAIERVYSESQGNVGETLKFLTKETRFIHHEFGKKGGAPK